MKKNFSVGQSNELIVDGTTHDLHNHYDYGGLTVGPDRTLRIVWVPNAEHGKGLRPLTLDGEGVDYLRLSEGFGTRRTADLGQFGYKNPGDPALEWLLGEDQATPEDHFVVQLGPDDYVRCHAARMTLR